MAEARPRFAAAFDAVVGARAGIASDHALFAEHPTGDDRAEAARLRSAVATGDLQAVLDGLAAHPDLIDERELAREVAQALAEGAPRERREAHLADARRLWELMELDPDDSIAVVDDAERDAVDAAAQLVRAIAVDHDDEAAARLREGLSERIYAALAGGAVARASNPDGLMAVLGDEAGQRCTEAALQGGVGLADLCARLDWDAALTDVFFPGAAEHNFDTLRQRLSEQTEAATNAAL